MNRRRVAAAGNFPACQLSLFPDETAGHVSECSDTITGSTQAITPEPDLRTIHYLGSKLRLLGPIREAISDLVPVGGRVCDLFAGSGAVSVGLSATWHVTSIDIQEYSRVLCNGLLNGDVGARVCGHAVGQSAARGALRSNLRLALADLINHEELCLRNASIGAPGHLCDLMEHGSLLTLAMGNEIPSAILDRKMGAAWSQLLARGLASGPETVITRHFGGVYFSWQQAIDFDALLDQVHRVDGCVRDRLLAAVLAVASEVVNTVGKQFAQPIRPRNAKGEPKRHLVNQTIRDRSISVFDRFEYWVNRFSSVHGGGGQHRAIRSDYNDALRDERLNFDAVYADPPYTRDHYSRYYHVLETMALHDEPALSTTMIRTGGTPKPSRGLYRCDRHQSPFCIKSQAPKAFEDLCRNVASRRVPLVLSYSPYRPEAGNRPRLLTVEELVAIVGRHFGKLECRTLGGVSHNKLNIVARNVDVDYHAEILLVCSP